MRYKIYQRPRGVNRGGVLVTNICTTISCSSWQHNVLLILIKNGKDNNT